MRGRGELIDPFVNLECDVERRVLSIVGFVVVHEAFIGMESYGDFFR